MISRRQWLSRAAASAAAVSVVGAFPSKDEPLCTLTHELTEGPFYVDSEILRRDITEGKPGLPLTLRVTVLDARRCTPIQNAAVDIWHCDASGIYSAFTANNPGRMPGPPPPGFGPRGSGPSPREAFGGRPMPPPGSFGGRRPTDKTTFCRGVQLTGNDGVAEFSTIYPGWYMGRDNHIHMKIHISGEAKATQYKGGHVAHTGQLFFADEITDEVAKLQPYAKHDTPRTKLTEDNVFVSGHSDASMLVTLRQVDSRSMSSGFVATAVVAIDPSATPSPFDDFGPPPR